MNQLRNFLVSTSATYHENSVSLIYPLSLTSTQALLYSSPHHSSPLQIHFTYSPAVSGYGSAKEALVKDQKVAEKRSFLLFPRTPEAAMPLAGRCHSGSGIQSFLTPATWKSGSNLSSAVPAAEPWAQMQAPVQGNWQLLDLCVLPLRSSAPSPRPTFSV